MWHSAGVPFAGNRVPTFRRITRLLFVLITLSSVSFTSTLAQPSRLLEDWRWVSFGAESGLPSNHIYSIVETESGTPWVFTKGGVAWYDDYVWHKVAFPKHPPFSKPQSFYNLHDRIILAYDSTVFVGDTSGFEAMEISRVEQAVPFPDGKLLLIRRDEKNRLALYLWDDIALTPLPLPVDVAPEVFIWIERTGSGTVWLGAGKQLFFWRHDRWEPKLFATSDVAYGWYYNVYENESKVGAVFGFGSDRIPDFWSWEKEGTALMDKSIRLGHKVGDIASDGTVLIADFTGLYFIRYKNLWSTHRLRRLSPRAVECVKFRKNGDLWLCTSRGLWLIRYASQRWQHASSGTPMNAVNDLLNASDSSLWLATDDGVRIRKRDGSLVAVREIFGQRIRAVTGLLEDGDGGIWICSGSLFKGVYRWNGSAWESIGAGTPLEKAYIHRMQKDRRGRVWLLGIPGSSGSQMTEGPGAFVYERGKVSRWELPSNRVYSFVEGDDGSLWFGTRAGISRWKDGAWRHWQLSELFDAAKVFTLAFDHEGQLWFSDQVNVVGVMQPDGKLRRITVEDGLPDEQVWEIKVDRKGRVWCTTQAGLAVYSNGLWTRFDEPSGIPNTVLWPVIPTDKNVLIGTTNGWIDLSLGGLEEAAPRVALDQPLTGENTVLLRWKAHARYGGVPSSQIVTRYRVNEGQWSHWSAIGEASLQDLAPGKYLYEVQSRPLLGTDSDAHHTARSGFVISVPLMKDPRVMIPAIVVVLALIVTIASFRTHARRLKQKQLHDELRREHEHGERLAQVDKLKSEFFTNISHEFRTPLTLVLGITQKWRRTLNPEAPRLTQDDKANRMADEILSFTSAQDVETAHRNAEKLHTLINQLLDFSKIEAGSMSVNVSEGDVVAFARQVVQSFQPWADQKKVQLNFMSDEEDVHGFFDEDVLEKILNNLISNALKFTPEEGMVQIALTPIPSPTGRGERGVRVVVSDTGIGIAPEHLPRIFDRFYRADSSHTTEGTGIGLALTKELVELHHGSIAVQSEPGRETRFTVSLPLAKEHFAKEDFAVEKSTLLPHETKRDPQAEPVESSIVQAQVTEPASTDVPLILVVEDNSDVRSYVRGCLPEYVVIESENGAEGLETARKTIPDLVISDIMMPVMNGYDFCKALKRDERTSHIPVILLTAKAAAENKIEGLQLGADDYLTKPFDAKELLVRTANLIEGRRKLREKFSKTVPLKPGDVAVTSMDDAFLQKAISVVERHISDEQFGVEAFCSAMALGRTQLHRKLHALTNQSATEFVRHIRLLRAHDLLTKHAGTVSEVAYQTGFGSLTYFTRCYHEQFCHTPSETLSSELGETSKLDELS
ncbi:MAG: response regulator [Ignavibacteriae bacterium]|nr:response regulator [Ignavibacteriota bacterium]